ncbi:glucocorticoid receptor-like (DNA-binding domain), partial [Neocallimastix californiae]
MAGKGSKSKNRAPMVCTVCKTTTSPLWRRGDKGEVLCNACGLYHKHHKKPRPIALANSNNSRPLRRASMSSASRSSPPNYPGLNSLMTGSSNQQRLHSIFPNIPFLYVQPNFLKNSSLITPPSSNSSSSSTTPSSFLSSSLPTNSTDFMKSFSNNINSKPISVNSRRKSTSSIPSTLSS